MENKSQGKSEQKLVQQQCPKDACVISAGPKQPVIREQNSNEISFLALQRQFAGAAVFDTIQLPTCPAKSTTTEKAKTVVDYSDIMQDVPVSAVVGKAVIKLGEWLRASEELCLSWCRRMKSMNDAGDSSGMADRNNPK